MSAPVEIVVLKGSGRGSAFLSCTRDVDIIPAHNGPKSGKRIIGLRVGNGYTVELYIEANFNISDGAYREFYYDSTISLPGGWQSYQNEKGFYDRQLSWSGDENPVAVSEVSVPDDGLYLSGTYTSSEQISYATSGEPDFGWLSEAVSVGTSVWDDFDDEIQTSIMETRPRVSITRRVSTRRVEVIRSKAERKLALDKDI
jgi:hypothetical protein